MAKKGGTVKFKNCTEKIKSTFMIYVNFENVLMTENQHNVGCSYGYKLVRVDDQFSKLFKTYLGQNAVISLSLIWSKKVNIEVVSKIILIKNLL